jgi:hypothetical protein
MPNARHIILTVLPIHADPIIGWFEPLTLLARQGLLQILHLCLLFLQLPHDRQRIRRVSRAPLRYGSGGGFGGPVCSVAEDWPALVEHFEGVVAHQVIHFQQLWPGRQLSGGPVLAVCVNSLRVDAFARWLTFGLAGCEFIKRFIAEAHSQ